MKIVIKVHKITPRKSEIVRLNKDGQEALYQLQRQTGCSSSYLVSEILAQAVRSGEIEIEEAGYV